MSIKSVTITSRTEIPVEQLEKGCWYMGEGRFLGSLGLWTGKRFTGMDFSCGFYCTADAEYGERGFSPYHKLEVV